MSSASFSDGVVYSRVLRGLPLRLRWMRARSSLLRADRSLPLGMYWRNRPLVFSFEPRCQGEWGSQKKTGDARGHREGTVARHFGAPVPGDGVGQLFGQGGDGFAHGHFDGWGSFALAEVQQKAVPRGSLDQGADRKVCDSMR